MVSSWAHGQILLTFDKKDGDKRLSNFRTTAHVVDGREMLSVELCFVFFAAADVSKQKPQGQTGSH